MHPDFLRHGGQAHRRTRRFDERGTLREDVIESVRTGQDPGLGPEWTLQDANEPVGEKRFRVSTLSAVITGSFIHGAVAWAAFYTLAFAPHWSLLFVIYGAAVAAMGWIWIFPHILVWMPGTLFLAFDHPISLVPILLAAAWIDPGKWAHADE